MKLRVRNSWPAEIDDARLDKLEHFRADAIISQAEGRWPCIAIGRHLLKPSSGTWVLAVS